MVCEKSNNKKGIIKKRQKGYFLLGLKWSNYSEKGIYYFFSLNLIYIKNRKTPSCKLENKEEDFCPLILLCSFVEVSSYHGSITVQSWREWKKRRRI